VDPDLAVRIDRLDALGDTVGFEVPSFLLQDLEHLLKDARVAGEPRRQVLQGHRALGGPVEAAKKLSETLGDLWHVAEMIGELSQFLDGVGEALLLGLAESEPEFGPPELRIFRGSTLPQVSREILAI